MEYDLAIKRNEVQIHGTTWMNLKKHYTRDFPGGSVVESPPANAGDTGSIPGAG